ncbi:Sister chromatid cohesion protein SCC2/Nipped-B [Ceraceosorus bombacis]|uniref:Sister chromatid cohesion protein n=1 Tax=Ceraceosorus bombacis TaxID=401625 RepID=A0A0P1BID9_9BASI|nr:Sister chromatid cohesion protein SCC2/Nipped-B [Ceraceosorus bombacis]
MAPGSSQTSAQLQLAGLPAQSPASFHQHQSHQFQQNLPLQDNSPSAQPPQSARIPHSPNVQAREHSSPATQQFPGRHLGSQNFTSTPWSSSSAANQAPLANGATDFPSSTFYRPDNSWIASPSNPTSLAPGTLPSSSNLRPQAHQPHSSAFSQPSFPSHPHAHLIPPAPFSSQLSPTWPQGHGYPAMSQPPTAHTTPQSSIPGPPGARSQPITSQHTQQFPQTTHKNGQLSRSDQLASLYALGLSPSYNVNAAQGSFNASRAVPGPPQQQATAQKKNLAQSQGSSFSPPMTPSFKAFSPAAPKSHGHNPSNGSSSQLYTPQGGPAIEAQRSHGGPSAPPPAAYRSSLSDALTFSPPKSHAHLSQSQRMDPRDQAQYAQAMGPQPSPSWRPASQDPRLSQAAASHQANQTRPASGQGRLQEQYADNSHLSSSRTSIPHQQGFGSGSVAFGPALFSGAWNAGHTVPPSTPPRSHPPPGILMESPDPLNVLSPTLGLHSGVPSASRLPSHLMHSNDGSPLALQQSGTNLWGQSPSKPPKHPFNDGSVEVVVDRKLKDKNGPPKPKVAQVRTPSPGKKSGAVVRSPMKRQEIYVDVPSLPSGTWPRERSAGLATPRSQETPSNVVISGPVDQKSRFKVGSPLGAAADYDDDQEYDNQWDSADAEGSDYESDDVDLILTSSSGQNKTPSTSASRGRRHGTMVRISGGLVKSATRRAPTQRLSDLMEDLFEADDSLPDRSDLANMDSRAHLPSPSDQFFELQMGTVRIAENVEVLPVMDASSALASRAKAKTKRKANGQGKARGANKRGRGSSGSASRSPARDSDATPPLEEEEQDAHQNQRASGGFDRGDASASMPGRSPSAAASSLGNPPLDDDPVTQQLALSGRINLITYGVLAADCCLTILTGDELPKHLASEDIVRPAFDAIKHSLERAILPFIEACAGGGSNSVHPLLHLLVHDLAPTAAKKGRTKASTKSGKHVADPSESGRNPGAQACADAFARLFKTTCSALGQIQRLVKLQNMALSESLVISAVYAGIQPFFVLEPESGGLSEGKSEAAKGAARGRQAMTVLGAGLGAMRSLRLPCLNLLRNVFARHQDMRQWIVEEILTSLIKLPDMRKSRRQHALRTGKSIHSVTALLLQLIQAASQGRAVAFQSSIFGSRQSAHPDSQSANQKVSDEEGDEDGVRLEIGQWSRALDGAKQAAREVAAYLMQRVNSSGKVVKTGSDNSYAAIVENLVNDLLATLFLPEWPAAGLLLTSLCRSFIASLDDPKSTPDARGVALDQIGPVAARLQEIQLRIKSSRKKEDYRAILLVCEEVGASSAFMVTQEYLVRSLITALDGQAVGNRTRALRSLGRIAVVDDSLLDDVDIRAAIETRLYDESASVREAALALLGRYALRLPERLESQYPVLCERVNDAGLSVRKRALRLLASIYATSRIQSTRIDACVRIVRCVFDEDNGMQELAVGTIGSLWLNLAAPSEGKPGRPKSGAALLSSKPEEEDVAEAIIDDADDAAVFVLDTSFEVRNTLAANPDSKPDATARLLMSMIALLCEHADFDKIASEDEDPLLCEHADFDKIASEDEDRKHDLRALCGERSVVEEVFALVLGLYQASPDRAFQTTALQSLGFMFRAHPGLITKESTRKIMSRVFHDGDAGERDLLLRIVREFLTSEQRRSSPEAANAKNRASLSSSATRIATPQKVEMNELIGNTETFADTGVSAALIQAYLSNFLEAARDVYNPSIQRTGMDILKFTVHQGVSHPLQCVPTLIALETVPDTSISAKALALHDYLSSKHASILAARYLDFAKESFNYQIVLQSDGPVRGHRFLERSETPVAALRGWYSLLRDKRNTRLDFLRAVVKALDVNTASGRCLEGEVLFARYIAENLAALEYKTLEEVFSVIGFLRTILSVTGMMVHSQVEDELNREDSGDEDDFNEDADAIEVDEMTSEGPQNHGNPADFLDGHSQALSSELSSVGDFSQLVGHSQPRTSMRSGQRRKGGTLATSRAALVMGVALLLRNHLKRLYNLSEEKCKNWQPNKRQSSGADRPATRKLDGRLVALNLEALQGAVPLSAKSVDPFVPPVDENMPNDDMETPLPTQQSRRQVALVQMASFEQLVREEGTLDEPDDKDDDWM